jgi:predicted amino acid dehydrogenase
MCKKVISISLGLSSEDYHFTTKIFDEEVSIKRFGTDGDLDRARELIAQFDGQADVMSLGEMNIFFKVGHCIYIHKKIKKLANLAKNTPVVDGIHIKNALWRWLISQVAEQHPELFRQKKIFIISGIKHYQIAQVLNDYSSQILFGDPIFNFNFAFPLRSAIQLERYAKVVMPILCRTSDERLLPINYKQGQYSPRGVRYFNQADVIVGDSSCIRQFAPNNMKRKVVISNTISADDLEDLRKRGVELVITIDSPWGNNNFSLGTDIIEAIFTTLIDRPFDEITDNDYLDIISRSKLELRIITLNEPPDIALFAQIIHPLSLDYIFNQPKLKYLRLIPHRLVERLIAKLRPRYLSRIKGIKSAATGKEVEGFLISLGATPRELMRRKPGFTYRRLIVASRTAQQMGAKIMGLGAFTKIVGDAGVSVAHKSDIAVTSGNSLTVSATLEAAKQAIVKMGGRTDRGRAIVVGATGSIGSVCSRILAQVSRDIVLVAPRPEKLISLKRIIEDETPDAEIIITTDAGPHLPSADLVVTTTSAFGKQVIDIQKLKPGCVVCDVASPPDIKEKDARLRPDVLVIGAGEILLPGEPDVGFNIGLPPGVVHACMAEVALLAMEGRFENFTLGRNIEIEKVKEIYRLAQKHGLRLASLRSFGRYITEEEIAHKRELANKLQEQKEERAASISN